MNLAKINEVVKASPAIQIQSKISLLQRRAWNVLLANAYNELPNQEIHRVSLVELAAKLGFDSKNEDYLKEVLRELRFCEVEWNLLNKDNKKEWGVAGLLAEVRIADGICFYQFPHTLRLKLYNPRVYAKLNLRLQNQFTSKYALVLWEVCFDYFDADRDQGETPFISLETFRELLGIESHEYPAFSIFNRAVIKPAIKEINDLTDYLVEVEQKRIGRPIAELKFRISKVTQLPIQESVFPDVEDLSPVAIQLIQSGVDRNMALEIADVEWELVTADKLPPPARIQTLWCTLPRKSRCRSMPQMSKIVAVSSLKPSARTIKTQPSKKRARYAPKKPEKKHLRTSPQSSESNAITSFGKPSMPSLTSLNMPPNASNLTSSVNASSNMIHP